MKSRRSSKKFVQNVNKFNLLRNLKKPPKKGKNKIVLTFKKKKSKEATSFQEEKENLIKKWTTERIEHLDRSKCVRNIPSKILVKELIIRRVKRKR